MTDTKISMERLARALGSHTVEQMAGKILRRYEKDVPPIKQFLRDGEDVVLVEYVRELLASRHQEPVEPAGSIYGDYTPITINAPVNEPAGGEAVMWHTIDIRGRLAEATDAPGVAQAWRDQGYTVLPLYAAPQPAPVVTDDMVDAGYKAAEKVLRGTSADIGVGELDRLVRAALTASLQKQESVDE